MPRQGNEDRTRSESREERGYPSEELTNLARAALVGSSDDLDRFLKACWQYAYTAASRFGRQHQGAEDSAQDAGMAVLRLLRLNPPELEPETIGAFVRVLVLRSARAAAARRAREADAVTHMATAREPADPAVAGETAEWARAVRDVVDSLPTALRRLIELHYVEELSTREIARVVGESKTSITRLLADAEATLKEKMRGLVDVNDDRGGRPPCQRRRA